MEPSSEMFETIMYPTAAFAPPPSRVADASPDFESSALNPRNRLDSLELPKDLQWTIDDGDVDGVRFFAVPLFAIGKPPLRIDVYIPDQNLHPFALKQTLNSHKTLTTSGPQLTGLGICRLILQKLHTWSASHDDFEAVYWSLPFGSRIIFGGIHADINSIPIIIEPFYEVERQWLSINQLRDLWKISEDRWPSVLDHSELQLQRQIHEAISIVKISSRWQSETFVFKSVSTDVKYLYHELKVLLTLEPHRHIIQRPLYIVAKKCSFGGKIGVCGFVLQYYPLGSLRHALEDQHTSGMLQARDKVRLARQILAALIHIQKSSLKFYTGIKPNNIVLSRSQGITEAVLIDFEQRSAWCSWSPPEVYYVEFLEVLANSKRLDEATRSKYSKILEQFIPGWSPHKRKARYTESGQGYARVWQAMSPAHQESAQVYMFGKLLWCLFENVGFPSNYITVETFREKMSDHPFPEFRRCPLQLRDCITRCTAGAPERKGRQPYVVRVGDKLYRRVKGSSAADMNCGPEDVQAAARAWWEDEIKKAERYVAACTRRENEEPELGAAEILRSIDERPTFQELHDLLAKIEAAL
ncbi:hypothetical protein O1611_g7579 [Lasiodiplodia mahajangana]|uniref:Uncharacterized protein n=1 Tax=Lasiodiplodia mahajangana TaxID=1108764 RepID=A0ACC2JFC6_9PEZI|nr:hypothetical protein O1611_g7579 [Lasiodiplodia mahajangana]